MFSYGGHAGADESGHVAGEPARLLCPSLAQTHEVQEGQLPQFPGLQARET